MKHKESPMLSALLYTLVAISLFLTVRILSTPSTVGLSQNSATSVSANLTNTKKVEDVFAPIRMIVQTMPMPIEYGKVLAIKVPIPAFYHSVESSPTKAAYRRSSASMNW